MKLAARDVRLWNGLNSHGVSNVHWFLGFWRLGTTASQGHFKQKRGRFELELELSMVIIRIFGTATVGQIEFVEFSYFNDLRNREIATIERRERSSKELQLGRDVAPPKSSNWEEGTIV